MGQPLYDEYLLSWKCAGTRTVAGEILQYEYCTDVAGSARCSPYDVQVRLLTKGYARTDEQFGINMVGYFIRFRFAQYNHQRSAIRYG